VSEGGDSFVILVEFFRFLAMYVIAKTAIVLIQARFADRPIGDALALY
jgi:hypothetical protein